MTALKLDD